MNMKIIQSVHEKQKFKSLSMHTISKRNKQQQQQQQLINNSLINLTITSLLFIIQQLIEQQFQLIKYINCKNVNIQAIPLVF